MTGGRDVVSGTGGSAVAKYKFPFVSRNIPVAHWYAQFLITEKRPDFGLHGRNCSVRGRQKAFAVGYLRAEYQ
jgi:hypothetical protein